MDTSIVGLALPYQECYRIAIDPGRSITDRIQNTQKAIILLKQLSEDLNNQSKELVRGSVDLRTALAGEAK